MAGRNQAALRQYWWTEQAEVTVAGQVRRTKDSVCRYGPDGHVVKTELTISSYLDDPKEPVWITVDFQPLPDGASYPATTIVSAKAMKLDVLTQNANYRKIGG